MSSKAKLGLGFGVVMTIFTIVESLIRRDNLSQKEILIIIASALVAGIVGGFLFSWLLGKLVTSKFFYDTTKIEMDAGETIVFETPANYYQGALAIGGKLILTEKRLIFKSHKLNTRHHKLIIDLADINQVGRRKTFKIINNGLTIQTVQGLTEKFVVERPGEWMKHFKKVNLG